MAGRILRNFDYVQNWCDLGQGLRINRNGTVPERVCAPRAVCPIFTTLRHREPSLATQRIVHGL